MRAPWHDTFASWLLLLIVDLAIAHGGFPRVYRLLRGIRVQPRRAMRDEAGIVEAVNDAVNRAAVWSPRTVRCLPRSAAAMWLLRRYGVPAVMVIGVRKMPFYAHAWVEVDGRVVNDAAKVQTLYPAIDCLVPLETPR